MDSPYDEENTILMIPGPIDFHPKIIREMSRRVYGHRTEFFRSILRDVHESLSKIFGVENGIVLSMCGSGTLAMDAALRSLVDKNSIILNLVCGKFSERFYEIAQTTPHARIVTKDVGAMLKWGQVFTCKRIKAILDRCEDMGLYPSVITLCHNETSTGVIHEVDTLARVVRDGCPDAYIVVDGITSVGAVPIDMERWGVDVFVAGSQKCLETPPGLSFVALSERVVDYLKGFYSGGKISFHKLNGYYNHLAIYLYSWMKKKDLPFTGAVSLYYALNVALKDILKEGMEKRYLRISNLAKILRNTVRAMGLRLLIEARDNVDVDKYSSPTVTAVVYPDELKREHADLDKKFRGLVREMGVLIAGGQSELKGEIFRVATMGRVGPREIITVIGAIEYALRKLGFSVERSGVEEAIRLIETFST